MKANHIARLGSCMVLGIGLLTGCGEEKPSTNIPASRPATPEESAKAAASVEAGRPNVKAPGAPQAPRAKP
jgi:hypothetical protein